MEEEYEQDWELGLEEEMRQEEEGARWEGRTLLPLAHGAISEQSSPPGRFS